MSSSAVFLGPIDQLPAEGDDRSLSSKSEIDFCADLFSDSAIIFDVSCDGVMVVSNPHETENFQEFEINLEAGSGEPKLVWKDNAFDIHLQGLVRDRSAFQTLSDASEPEDFVRRFLEVLASSLDEPAIGHKGPTVPMIRWRAGDDGESAQIQLLGVLLASDDQFESLYKNADGEMGLIFEDAEVKAHGLRETITVMALLGVTLGATTQADAGLFKKAKAKKEAQRQAILQQQAIQAREAAIRQARAATGFLDTHNDAYINYQLLDASKDRDRVVVVDISRQRAYLIVDNVIAVDTAVSTARSGKYTPRGEFKITERIASGKTSTIYGCDLPYWQRLDSSAIGMHVGDLPGHPASAGCIRLPVSVAPVMFANMSSGTTVKVVDQWDGSDLEQGVSNQNIVQAQVAQQYQTDS
jgi:lipoprotein-anchoring transpeptidase ErfK/SrfK